MRTSLLLLLISPNRTQMSLWEASPQDLHKFR